MESAMEWITFSSRSLKTTNCICCFI